MIPKDLDDVLSLDLGAGQPAFYFFAVKTCHLMLENKEEHKKWTKKIATTKAVEMERSSRWSLSMMAMIGNTMSITDL
jgi:hypothetical protein